MAQFAEEANQKVKGVSIWGEPISHHIFIQNRDEFGMVFLNGGFKERVVKADWGRFGGETGSNGLELGEGLVEEA